MRSAKVTLAAGWRCLVTVHQAGLDSCDSRNEYVARTAYKIVNNPTCAYASGPQLIAKGNNSGAEIKTWHIKADINQVMLTGVCMQRFAMETL